MTSMELLEILGSVKDKYVVEAHAESASQGKRVPFRKSFLIAAIIALMLLLAGCVAVFLGLRELELGKYTYDAGFGETQSGDFISLQGYMGSANYQAAKEWQDYLAAYDADGALLADADNDDYDEPMEYMAYQCYTPEMQAKIDEICETYGLEILGPTYFPDDPWQMLADLGVESFFADANSAVADLSGAYCYRDGTFRLEGETLLIRDGNPWPHPVNYEYRCVMKTAFDGVYLNIGEPDSYEQWNYTVKDGTEVLLALNSEKALIIADLPTHFVTVNILLQADAMDRAALEAIADTFRFDYTPHSPAPDTLEEPEWFTEAPETEPEQTRPETAPLDGDSIAAEWEQAKAKFEALLSGEDIFFYRDQCKGMTLEEYCSCDVSANLDITKYALADLDRDGIPELILWTTIDGGNDYGMLVLHCENGGAGGYTFSYRQMIDLKKDGTFGYSGGVADTGFAGLTFSENGWEYEKIGWIEENDNGVSFFWNRQAVSEDAYWQFVEEQSAKENVAWMDYPSQKYDLAF